MVSDDYLKMICVLFVVQLKFCIDFWSLTEIQNNKENPQMNLHEAPDLC